LCASISVACFVVRFIARSRQSDRLWETAALIVKSAGKNSIVGGAYTTLPIGKGRSKLSGRCAGRRPVVRTGAPYRLARGGVPVMVALRLFLPDNWTSDV